MNDEYIALLKVDTDYFYRVISKLEHGWIDEWGHEFLDSNVVKKYKLSELFDPESE